MFMVPNCFKNLILLEKYHKTVGGGGGGEGVSEIQNGRQMDLKLIKYVY